VASFIDIGDWVLSPNHDDEQRAAGYGDLTATRGAGAGRDEQKNGYPVQSSRSFAFVLE
jgi:hypothetical protein